MFTQDEKEIIQKALNNLSSIPNDKFITKEFTNNIDSCCAIGHLNRLESNDPKDYSFNNCCDFDIIGDEHPIRELSKRFMNKKYNKVENLARVNNGDSKIYRQTLPKERSVALLTDMLNTE